MLLAVDVGNTNIVLGAYRGRGKAAELVGDFRIRTDRDRTTDEHGMLVKELLEYCGLSLGDIRHVAISSVVPTMNETLADLSRRYFHAEPFFTISRSRMWVLTASATPSARLPAMAARPLW